MKKIGDLMKEAGFNDQAKTSVKEAFIKHLIKASTGVSVTTPSEKKEILENPKSVLSLKGTFQTEAQLSFDFEETSQTKPKKAATF